MTKGIKPFQIPDKDFDKMGKEQEETIQKIKKVSKYRKIYPNTGYYVKVN